MRTLGKKLYGVSLVALAFSLNIADVSAQTCTPAPSCDTLGFTKSATDCEGHSVLKCPFDQSKLYCDNSATAGNSGERGYCGSPEVGDVLYSDMTCAKLTNLDKSKTPIGVIFDNERRLAVALKRKSLKWSEETFDIPDLPNKDFSTVEKDFDGKNNTKIAVAYCKENNKSCPAFEYVSNYKTVGTNAGDWYLPAGGELKKIYDNISALNETLEKLSPENVISESGTFWSSSESNAYWAWVMFTDYDKIFGDINKSNGEYDWVHPVLAF